MIEQTLARTGTVSVDVVWHTPDDGSTATEQWPVSSLAFTSAGAWSVRSSGGSGQVDSGSLLVIRPEDEYECKHPHGVSDRSLSVTFLNEIEPVGRSLVPVDDHACGLRRRLWRAATARAQDAEEIDALAAWLLAWARLPGDAARGVGAATRARVAEVRQQAERHFADPGFDLVAAGAAAGLSRTRLIHAFRAVVGVTPHRFLVERRVSHAAVLLAARDMPVADVCFASGFGSVSRFNAAFRGAYGISPTAYRAICQNRPPAWNDRRTFRADTRAAVS